VLGGAFCEDATRGPEPPDVHVGVNVCVCVLCACEGEGGSVCEPWCSRSGEHAGVREGCGELRAELGREARGRSGGECGCGCVCACAVCRWG